MELRLKDVALMCGGELSLNTNPDLVITDVVIDSRIAKSGSLFVAIMGENSDGHDYVARAFENGACAALVNITYASKNREQMSSPTAKEQDRNVVIYVEDTVKALGRFAHNYRKLFNIPVVGITGSNGKTTVKEMLKSICIEEFGEKHVLATTGNLNNHLGMPLTLLSLNKQHKIAIVEMGMNHSGELDYLSKIANPTIAIVNNVMLAHAGFFNDITDIASAKGEIYHGLIDGGIACINLAVKEHDIWLKDLANRKVKIVTYGREETGFFISDNATNNPTDSVIPTLSLDNSNDAANFKDDNVFVLSTPLGQSRVSLQVLGQHNQTNALTATVIAVNVGCSLKNIVSGLTNYKGYKGRLERKNAFNGALIIDDSYNANPASVKAAILAIKHLPRPHWFIFADLKELGKFAQDAHKEIGHFAYDNGIDQFITFGELAKVAGECFIDKVVLNKAAVDGKSSLHYKEQKDIINYCKKNLPTNATLLVKGSHSMNLDRIVDNIIEA